MNISCETAKKIHEFLVLLLILLVVFLLTGCSVLQGPVQEQAAKAVNKYCTEFTYTVRSDVIRPQFNLLIAPNKAKIDCLGDPDNPAP